MKTLSTLTVGAVAMTLLAAGPAAAQRYDRDRDRDDTGRNAILGAVVGGIAGAAIGNGDGTYVVGGALAGAALGASASNRGSGCEYYRGGRCYRNQGHWERDHGINSRDGRYGDDRRGYYGRRDYRDDRREWRRDRRDDRRDWRYERRRDRDDD